MRPLVDSDVGALHTDHWFYQVYRVLGPSQRTLKIWIPVFIEPGLNGLIVVPGSQHKQWRVRYVDINGYPKPHLDEAIEEPYRATLLMTSPGNLVLFNECLIHGGAINHGKKTRVSAELTLIFSAS